MSKRHIDRLPGGLADKSKPSDFDPEQLRMGIAVEREHVGNDKALAREIAMDHLKEDPKYYSKLKRIHKESDMDILHCLGFLNQIRESLEEAAPVRATGKTSGFLPGVSKPGEKASHFKRFPQKTVKDTKRRGEAQRLTRSGAPAGIPQARQMSPKKKKGLLGRAISRFKNESIEIRRLLEVDDSRYGGGSPLNPRERAAKGLSKKGKASFSRRMKRF